MSEKEDDCEICAQLDGESGKDSAADLVVTAFMERMDSLGYEFAPKGRIDALVSAGEALAELCGELRNIIWMVEHHKGLHGLKWESFDLSSDKVRGVLYPTTDEDSPFTAALGEWRRVSGLEGTQ